MHQECSCILILCIRWDFFFFPTVSVICFLHVRASWKLELAGWTESRCTYITGERNGDAQQHLSRIEPFPFLNIYFFHPWSQILSVRIRILANHQPGLNPRRPHVKLGIKKCLLRTIGVISGKEMFCLRMFLRARVTGAAAVIERQERRTVCTWKCIGACACLCMPVLLCACLKRVQLWGTCSSAGFCDVILPPILCVFTPVWVNALQLSSWDVCVHTVPS